MNNSPCKRGRYLGQDRCASGSISPATAQQIYWSLGNGFEYIPSDATTALVNDQERAAQIESIVKMALMENSSRTDPLIYTAVGRDDPAVSQLNRAIESSGHPASEVNQIIGISLGKILYRIIDRAKFSRAIISGGDTSGYATQQLGIFVLSAMAPTIPGPLYFARLSKDRWTGWNLP